jgi:carboxyl-terminal processing protease
VFLPPVQNEVFQGDVSGSFGGVGMEIGVRDRVITVIAPLKDTPAAKAGILAGDKIFMIDGETTEGLSVEKAVSKIRGEVGTAIVLTIVREGDTAPREISVVRETITVPIIESYLRTDGIFVIELSSFSANSPQAFRDALRQFSTSGSKKLILDLRDNPGGYLEAAVDMASWFLPAGEIIVTEDFGEKRDSQHQRSYGYDIFAGKDLKMVILINRGSASASEILAGALAQNGVATLIGEQSFGKGSVQELVNITPETALKVTVAQWLTPNGTSISKGGLTPDVEVKRTAEDFENDLDPQMEKAAEYLRAR